VWGNAEITESIALQTSQSAGEEARDDLSFDFEVTVKLERALRSLRY
jgi:hypothetical protein